MALEGSLTDFGLADILQLIYFQKKTGVLTLEGKMDRVRLLFIEGNISGAESKRRIEDNRLGKILVKRGLMTDDDLSSILEEQRSTGSRFAHLAIRRNLVEKAVIQEILQGQITETVIQLFGWKQGTYEFASQGVPRDKELDFTVDTQHLLMEGLRIVDEWSLIKGKITLDTVFRRKTQSPPELTGEEAEIFRYVDGENDVSTIIDLSAMDNFQVSKTLLALMEKEIIEAVAAAPVVHAEKALVEKRRSGIMAVLLPAVLIGAAVLSLSAFLTTRHSPYRVMKAAEQIEELRFRIEAYRIEHSSYPQSLSVISEAKDPWGRPYLYRIAENAFLLESAGPDGIPDTKDDVY
jgi:hypothetical protein